MELNDLNTAEGAEVPDNVADVHGCCDETEENQRVSLQLYYGGRPNSIFSIVPISPIFPICEISSIFPMFQNLPKMERCNHVHEYTKN